MAAWASGAGLENSLSCFGGLLGDTRMTPACEKLIDKARPYPMQNASDSCIDYEAGDEMRASQECTGLRRCQAHQCNGALKNIAA